MCSYRKTKKIMNTFIKKFSRTTDNCFKVTNCAYYTKHISWFKARFFCCDSYNIVVPTKKKQKSSFFKNICVLSCASSSLGSFLPSSTAIGTNAALRAALRTLGCLFTRGTYFFGNGQRIYPCNVWARSYFFACAFQTRFARSFRYKLLSKSNSNVLVSSKLVDSDDPQKKINKQIPLPASGQATRVIVITSGKGGVGKTTATANLGMSIARLGYRVALIDSDIGLRNLDLLLGLENRIMYTAMDILEGQCRLDQALIRDKRWKNLSLLSISKNRQRYNVTRKNMENLVNSITSLGYHFILIDCPAGIDVGFINAISPADEALIVTTPCDKKSIL
jgi:Mrp family chromosome partitioning ATPase